MHFCRKIQDWILKSQNGFCVSLLNRSSQDLLDHGASKEPKNLFCQSGLHVHPILDQTSASVDIEMASGHTCSRYELIVIVM